MLITEKTSIEGLLLIKPDIFVDNRGTYVQLYDSMDYKNILPENIEFVQEDYSYSIQDVLRGIHGDYRTAKLISIIYGEVLDAVIDNRPDSPTYLQPEGCGNGMLALSNEVIFHYKQTSHYEYQSQFTIKWNDPRFNIDWGIKYPILSNRDLKGDY
jgi:dTDP-4-dehydrorhamnose 3,5-epimerase